MKKIIGIGVFILMVLAGVWSTKAMAKENKRPSGLEGKGPLSKITFIHRRKGYGKPPWAGGGKDKTSSCYGFLARGAKWKTIENYFVNPSNSGLKKSFVNQAFENSVGEWEEYGGNIFGDRTTDDKVVYDGEMWDGNNVAAFGFNLDSNVIAVTTIWGYFYGPPKTRELVEWDMLFNANFPWGDAEDSTEIVMDLQNIATHELGHSAGMNDLYETSCNLETMYGYSDYGETIKRFLNAGDIAGIQELYK